MNLDVARQVERIGHQCRDRARLTKREPWSGTWLRQALNHSCERRLLARQVPSHSTRGGHCESAVTRISSDSVGSFFGGFRTPATAHMARSFTAGIRNPAQMQTVGVLGIAPGKGSWFLSGEGGPLTRWAQMVGNMTAGGSGPGRGTRCQALRH
jgi:hypothetical protein